MCGIFGIVSTKQEHRSFVSGQMQSLRHRGPDEEGTWSNQSVVLGNCRLSIIDIAGGHQPMLDEKGTSCIVYNGELYNFQDLRAELKACGHQFRTNADTEVVFRAYQEWGISCLDRFNGMFAFAIWDESRRRLVIARDRLGEKPLYYYRGPDRIVFASEIKTIVADPTIPREIDPHGLVNYLAYGHAMSPDTMFKGISKLPPGHTLILEGEKVTVEQYWDVVQQDPIDAIRGPGIVAAEDRLIELLDDAVRRRMVADVPVGAFLSGGVDSSAIVALMKRHATGRVKTFSLGFTVGGAYNELDDARRVASYLGTEHHELHVDHLDLVDTLNKLVYQYDEPFGDAANFPTYLLSEFARKQVKVVLAGEGGDELFGGYRRYVAEQAAPLYRLLPDVVTTQIIPAALRAIPRFRRTKRIARTLPTADPAARYAKWLEVFTDEMRSELLLPSVANDVRQHDPTLPYRSAYRTAAETGRLDHINSVLYVDLKTWLPDTFLEKVDKATMAFGLEGRLPFLDHRLVEFAFRLPGATKVRGLSTKRILKNAVRGLVPPFVLQKRKHGFAVPTDPWFRGDLRDFVFDTLFDDRARRRGYFNYPYIEKLYANHAQGAEVLDTPLWLLLNFELWCRRFIDRSTERS